MKKPVPARCSPEGETELAGTDSGALFRTQQSCETTVWPWKVKSQATDTFHLLWAGLATQYFPEGLLKLLASFPLLEGGRSASIPVLVPGRRSAGGPDEGLGSSEPQRYRYSL